MSSVEQRARELWADWHRQRGCGQQIIDDCLSGVIQMDGLTRSLVHAALREQPEARGVVDAIPEAVRKALDTLQTQRAFLRDGGKYAKAIDTVADYITAAQQPGQEGGGAKLTNPWTGEPRDYRDVNSDPEGALCVEPGAPLKAAPDRAGLTVKTVAVPVGYVLVPEKFGISADAWEAAAFAYGGPATGEGESYMDCTAWVGYIEDDDGAKRYGLHVSCDECPEEGSITVAEFPEASPTPPGDDAAGGGS